MLHPLWSLFMSMQHERIHLETSSVLIRELPLHLVSRSEHWPELAPCNPSDPDGSKLIENKMIKITGHHIRLGKEIEKRQ